MEYKITEERLNITFERLLNKVIKSMKHNSIDKIDVLHVDLEKGYITVNLHIKHERLITVPFYDVPFIIYKEDWKKQIPEFLTLWLNDSVGKKFFFYIKDIYSEPE
jgi:ribosome-associated toxin RatA of RatAB toxin-antitoxin module